MTSYRISDAARLLGVPIEPPMDIERRVDLAVGAFLRAYGPAAASG